MLSFDNNTLTAMHCQFPQNLKSCLEIIRSSFTPIYLFQIATMSGQFWGVKKTCKNGETCEFLSTDSCWFKHTEHEKDLAKLRNKPIEELKLWELCKVGDKEALKEALRRKGEDVNCCDDEGNTGLMWAVENDDLSMVKLLVNTPGIDLNKQNTELETALHKAMMPRADAMLDILLPVVSKEQFEIKNINNQTPLEIAMDLMDGAFSILSGS